MKWSLIKRKLARVDRALDKAIEKAEMPGAVVLARMPRDGEVLEHESVRGLAVMRPERLPMRRDTIFDVASLTKVMVTTTGIMLLEAEGKLTLDDPVAQHLPVFAERDKGEVTIRHLLTHSAGLKPWRGFHENLIDRENKSLASERLLQTPQGREWIIERVLKSALVHEPGEAAVYGDLDFIALGALIEEVAGEPLDMFASKRIFEPLGLVDTSFVRLPDDGSPIHPDPHWQRRVAATENCPWRERILWGEVHDPNAAAMGGVAGHAGVFSTADDLLRFGQAMIDAWHGRSEWVSQEVMRRYAERQHMPDESDWALGWDTPTEGASSSGQHFSEHSIGHLGFTGTSLWIDLEREAVVVMLTNRVHLVAKRSKFDLRPEVHDLLLDAFDAG